MTIRSSDRIKRKLIKSIIEGEFKINEPLLPERELADKYHVGRPTIREALQSLERDGWITARNGMPAIVNDYWTEGNLMTIVNILQCYEDIPDIFIEHMLGIRISITPAYIKEAISCYPVKVISLFTGLEALQDEAESYAYFDWHLQKKLAQLSTNPIYLLIINSFAEIYVPMATKYFSVPSHRKASKQYYNQLLASVLKGDLIVSEQIVKNMMEKSLQLWKEKSEGMVGNEEKGFVS